MKKRKLVVIVSMMLIFTFASSSLVFAADPVQPAQASVQTPVQIDNEALSNFIQEEAATILRDPIIPWTYSNVTSYTNTQFQVAVVSAIAAALAAKFGGASAEWQGMAAAIVSGWISTEYGNTYQIVKYYWQPAYNDPQLPYYVKQVVYCYSDSARTHLMDIKIKYYYSSTTW